MGAVMLKKINHPKAVTLINLFIDNFLNIRFSIQYPKKEKAGVWGGVGWGWGRELKATAPQNTV